MEERKEKFILTTSSLFTKSFILFSIMATLLLFSLFNLDGILEDLIPVNFFDLAVIVFFISVPFYILMPVIRFIFNFRKIETEEEKKSVSGFYVRYFGGLVYSFILMFIASFSFSTFNDFEEFSIFGIFGLTLFYIASLSTLPEDNFLNKYFQKYRLILSTRLLFSISLGLFLLQTLPDLLFSVRIFGLFSVFYIFLPIIRLIMNNKQVETEEEKEIVSGFYQRYFAGIATYLLVNLLFYSSLLYRSEDYLIFYTVFGVLFHVIALKTLKSEVYWFGNQKI